MYQVTLKNRVKITGERVLLPGYQNLPMNDKWQSTNFQQKQTIRERKGKREKEQKTITNKNFDKFISTSL